MTPRYRGAPDHAPGADSGDRTGDQLRQAEQNSTKLPPVRRARDSIPGDPGLLHVVPIVLIRLHFHCASSDKLRLIELFAKGPWLIRGRSLSSLQSMLQVTVCDSGKPDAFTFCEDRLHSAEVDVSPSACPGKKINQVIKCGVEVVDVDRVHLGSEFLVPVPDASLHAGVGGPSVR